MKIRRTAVSYVGVVCCVALLLGVSPYTRVSAEEDVAKKVDAKCEACQIIAYHLDAKIKQFTPKTKSKGARDVIVAEWVDPLKACEWSDWKGFADKVEGASQHDLTKQCNNLMGDEDFQESLENAFGRKLAPKELSIKMCTDFCKKGGGEGLWKDGDDITVRIGKKEKNKIEGKKWLEENAKKEGVTVLESGLQYKILEKGEGTVSPKVDQEVKVHYEGKLTDGTKFDSSYDRNEPTAFAPNQVIRGWTEALQMMHKGDKWEVYIPSDLGYGEQGSPPKIPENSVLVFKMELVALSGVDYGKGSKKDDDESDEEEEDDAPTIDQVPEESSIDEEGDAKTQETEEADKVEL